MKLGINRDAQRGKLLAALADLRWRRETGGLTLPDGAPVRTDRETRGLINEALSSLEGGFMVPPVRWKLSNGVHADLTLADLSAIKSAVALHVKAAFEAEAAVAKKIAAAPGADLDAFDVPAAFEAAVLAAG